MTTHGHAGKETRAYRSWLSMRQRCLNPNSSSYRHYGGKGITVCKRWDSFAAFLADMGERPEGTTLDRKNAKRGYTKSNCRWATPMEQARGSRIIITHDGLTMGIKEWALRLGVSRKALYLRLRRGKPIQEALTGGTP